MSRTICPICQRPTKVCLCAFIQNIDNQVEVGILQHPSEVDLVKGTAKIAQLSLNNCQTWCGEELQDLPGLVNWLTSDKPVFLLYPAIEGQTEPCEFYTVEHIRNAYDAVQDIKLLILDVTWRKTHKIMMLNSELRGLNRVVLQPQAPSAYRIRKQKDESSLSTIEALYEALSQLEEDLTRYQPLLNAFESMQQQQLAFRKSP